MFVGVSYVLRCVEEQRVCPDDGKTYTFEELQEAYKGALVFVTAWCKMGRLSSINEYK